jgi:DNA-binding transcriptional MerR regulator
MHAMNRLQVLDKNGQPLDDETLRLLRALGFDLNYIEEVLTLNDVGEVVAVLVRECKARCDWDSARWICKSRLPVDYEAIIERREGGWSATIRFHADSDAIRILATARMIEELEKLKHKVSELHSRVKQLESTCEYLKLKLESQAPSSL